MAQQWYYINTSMEKVGPISAQALKVLAQNGVITPGTTLQLEGGSKMIEAGTVSGLFTPKPLPTVPSAPPSGVRPADNYQVLPPASSYAAPPSPAPPQGYPQQPQSYSPYASPYPVNTPYPNQGPYPGQPVYPNQAPAGGQPNYQNPMPASGFDFPDLTSAGQTPNNYDPFAKPVSSRRHSSYSSNNNLLVKKIGSAIVSILIVLVICAKIARPFVREMARQRREEAAAQQDGTATPAPVLIKNQPIKDEVAKKENKGRLTTEEIVADVEGSVALIQGKEGSGSGFVVLPGIIVTNYHVIGSEFINELEVFFPSEKGSKHGPFKAELLYCHPDRDIAFLQLNSKEHRPLAMIDDFRFRRGQEIIAIGSPGRGDGEVLENAVSKGVLSTKTKMEEYDYYQLSIAVNPGNSGGPVFNDEGFVIGVVTLKSTETEAMAFCIPPDELRKMVELVRKGEGTTIQDSRKAHDALLYCNRGLDKMKALKTLADAPAEVKKKIAQEGFEDFEKAVQRAPDNPIAWFGRGIFKIVKEDFTGGLADLDKSIELAKVSMPPVVEKYTAVRDQLKELIAQASRGGSRRIPMTAFAGWSPPSPSFPSTPMTPPPGYNIPPPRMPEGFSRGPRISPGPFAGRRPSMFGDDGNNSPQPELTEEQKQRQEEARQRMLDARRKRYDEVVAKEDWTFNGKPLKGTIIGYDDKEGMVKFKLKDTGEAVERYASRFSDTDIADIRTYAMHHNIPTRKLNRR